jgi:putative FmdB family regulatory protein
MPIYEYLCNECESKFEQMRPISQCEKPADCPRCHKPAPRALSVFNGFITGESGVAQAMPGSGAGSCAHCSSGSCKTCAS